MLKKLAVLVSSAITLCLVGEARARATEDIEQFARGVVVEAGQTTGDVVCFFCSVRVRGIVGGDVVTIGGGIEIDGEVTGDAVASGGGVRLGPRAEVGGDAVAVAGLVERDLGAGVSGSVDSSPWAYVPGQRQLYWRSVVLLVAVNVGLVLLAALLLRRRRVEAMAGALRSKPVWTLFTGAGVLAVSTGLYTISEYLGSAEDAVDYVVSVLLTLLILAGITGLSAWLGRKISPGGGPLRTVFAGAILLAILQLIPVVGMVVFVVLVIIAPGIATLSGFGSAEDWLPRRLSRRRALVPAGGDEAAGGE